MSIQAFKKQLALQVANHSIYVWGGSGQLCKDVTEEWIRKKEARNDGGKHADEAVAAWRAVMASPYKDVARVFDCSGYISFALMQVGALDKRRDCDGLYSKCDPTDELRDGTLLFRVNKENPNDETHVGAYFGGMQYHSKGRKDGVVCEPFKASYWAKFGWFRGLQDKEPTHKYVKVKGGSVRVRSGNGTKYPSIGTVHRGDLLPCFGTDDRDPYWYMVKYKGQDAYITSNERYTELIWKL